MAFFLFKILLWDFFGRRSEEPQPPPPELHISPGIIEAPKVYGSGNGMKSQISTMRCCSGGRLHLWTLHKML